MARMSTAELWTSWIDTRSPGAREKIVQEYMPLVRRTAGKMARTLPGNELTELISIGSIGLLRAMEHWDPVRGVEFEAYAHASIRGAILDELRSADWAPRSLRQKARLIEKAAKKFEADNARQPSDYELAHVLDMPCEEIRAVRREVDAARMDYIDDESKPLPRAATTTQDERPGAILMTVERVLRNLPAKERLAITLYFYENLTLAQVAAVMGINESRASALNSRAMMKVSDELAKVLRQNG
jgi:RNA polymerase sigma factor FliA